jgi:hypothetical protein
MEYLIDKRSMMVLKANFNQNSSLISITSEEDSIKIYSTKEKKIIKEQRSHMGGSICTSFDPKGKYIASGGRDGHIKIWNLVDYEEEQVFENRINRKIYEEESKMNFNFGWSNNGKYLVVPGQGRNIVTLIQRDTWKIVKNISEENVGLIYNITLCPIDGYVVCCDKNKLYFVNVFTEYKSEVVHTIKTNSPVDTIKWIKNGDGIIFVNH